MKTGNVVFGTRRSSTRFPKFVKEVAAMYHELRKAGTRVVDVTFASVLPQTHKTNVKSAQPTPPHPTASRTGFFMWTMVPTSTSSSRSTS